MKKICFKFSVFLLTFALVISSLGIIAYADEKEGNSVTNTDVLEQAVETSENSYANYLEQKGKNFADEEIKLDVNATVSTEPVEFNINISEDGLYNLGFSYKAVDNGNGSLELGVKIDGEYPFSEAENLYQCV